MAIAKWAEERCRYEIIEPNYQRYIAEQGHVDGGSVTVWCDGYCAGDRQALTLNVVGNLAFVPDAVLLEAYL